PQARKSPAPIPPLLMLGRFPRPDPPSRLRLAAHPTLSPAASPALHQILRESSKTRSQRPQVTWSMLPALPFRFFPPETPSPFSPSLISMRPTLFLRGFSRPASHCQCIQPEALKLRLPFLHFSDAGCRARCPFSPSLGPRIQPYPSQLF